MKRYHFPRLVLYFLLAARSTQLAIAQSPALTPSAERLHAFTKEEIEDARKKGLPEVELIPYLEARRKGIPKLQPGQQHLVIDPDFKMKLLSEKSVHGNCENGGFEMGNFTNWSGSYGYNSNGTLFLNSFTSGFVAGRHEIASALWPSYFLPFTPPVFPDGGNKLLRLGNNSTGSEAETVSMTFQVTPANADFRFHYAVVLEDPSGHEPNEKPFFSYLLTDLDHVGPGPGYIDGVYIVANSSDPFFEKNANGTLVWRKDTCHKVDLSSYMGHHVTATFATADCALSWHYGYAYIDGLCEGESYKPILTMAPVYCPGQPVMADGTQTKHETQYTWTVVETDSSGSNANGATLATETFSGQITAPKDMRAWYFSKGKSFQCGHYYSVTLGTESGCGAETPVTQTLLISCPPSPTINGPSNTCDGGGTYSVNAEAGTTYTWTILNGTPSSATGTSVSVTWNTPNNGIVHVTATNACGTTGKNLTAIACKDKCCQGTTLSANGGVLIPLGGGAYTFNPTLKATPPNTMKINASMISTSIAYSPPSCGSSGPANSYVVTGGTVSGFPSPTVSVPNGREVVWTSASPLGTNISGGKVFPFTIQLPPPPSTNCADMVTFCIKYTFTDTKCNTCELVTCYCFKRFPHAKGHTGEPIPQLVQCPPPTTGGNLPNN